MTADAARQASPQAHQESYYGEDVDYRSGSPHLTHWPLYERLVHVVRETIGELAGVGLDVTVLEIGAGHGGYTEPVLAAGCRVTAVEASRPALRTLERRYGINRNFRTVFDADGSLDDIQGPFSLILIVSVLHHIPEYLPFIERAMRLLAPGGSLLTLQDPMWYARLGRTHALDRAGYYLWRLRQGNWVRGSGTLLRRLRGHYDEANPADMVEYHVVRAGVDEIGVTALLENHFESVTLLTYWSNQSAAIQKIGERLKVVNTFGMIARRYAPTQGSDGVGSADGDNRPGHP